ncbi:hypothetical protein BJV78DRAFT_1160628 [Lactifluus subvellereus]|nr:hypothetical protein BJV78DRAFT_1160628 [Lactifluus subvellereus]
MSFQNFRLDAISVQPQHIPPSFSTPASALASTSGSANPIQDGATRGVQRGPYGSGDMDDGYTLVFENLEAFHAWRKKEEEEKVVEFVKGDTHGSKAVPPRFKDHVKLVCARHSRSGRKKYVKKYPERVRKVPSRKLEGGGCPASMSYKTYFDTSEVRVCYMSQHSHEIGFANLPFTRRGRRAQAAAKSTIGGPDPSVSPASHSQPGMSDPQPNAAAGHAVAPMRAHLEPPHAFSTPYPHFPSMSMPLPQGLGTIVPLTLSGSAPAPAPLPFPVPSPATTQPIPGNDRERMERERWDRMDVLYQSIRNNAREFEYPPRAPIPAPHPQAQPAYAAATVPMAHLAPPQQSADVATGHGNQSDSASGSDGEDDEE